MSGPIGAITRRELTALCLAAPFAGLLPALAQAASRAVPDGTALANDIGKGRSSALAATDAALERIAMLNPTVGAVVYVDAARARSVAERIQPGVSPLAGVPILVKDLVDVRGMPTRRGSRTTSAVPAESQSSLIDAIEAAGLVIVGKSQTPEFGSSPTTEPVLGPITRNPMSLGHIVGGSSGGAAAAVAAGMVALAHGSDGGGSLRMPASCCGVFALKPSRGRLISPGGPRPRIEMSVPGAVSRSVRDNAVFLYLLQRRDSAARLRPIDFVKGPARRRLRIGINLKTLRGQDPDPEIMRVVTEVAAHCRSLGHDVRPFDWNFGGAAVADALGTTMLAAFRDIASGIMQQRKVAVEETGLEPLHIHMAQAGFALQSEQIEQAFMRLEEVQAGYPAIFAERDLILTPTLAQLSPLLGQLDNPGKPLEEVLGGYIDFSPYTPVQNIAGAPAMSLPLGISRRGLPIGVHVAGPLGAEQTLLELAYELEATMRWRPGSPSDVMPLSNTPQQIANGFVEAMGDGRDVVRFVRWLGALWGEEVLVTHEPAMPGDGPRNGRAHGEREITNFTALKRVLPDFRYENFTFRTKGDVVEVEEEIVATLPGGGIGRVPLRYRFTLRDARIVHIHGMFDPAVPNPFREIGKAAAARSPG